VRQIQSRPPTPRLNVTREGYWQIAMDDLLIGGASMGQCGAKGCAAIVDTAGLWMQLTHSLQAPDVSPWAY
jgi:hypothetical protein